MRPDITSIFVSVDIETTGLDPETCDTLEVGAVIDDWLFPLAKPPEFHCYIKQSLYRGQPFALSMHPTIFRRIAIEEEGYSYFFPGEFAEAFGSWLNINHAYVIDPDNLKREARGVVAGKNFASFDDRFLRKFKNYDQHVKFHQRILDPGMMFWSPTEDTKPPGSQTCMERTNQEGKVAHTALEDAKSVAKMIQTHAGRASPATDLVKIAQYRGIKLPAWLEEVVG